MKLSRIGFGLGATAVVVACAACSSTPATEEARVSSEMQEAIDTYVRLQAAEVDGGSGNARNAGGGLGGIDAVELGGALKAGASSIPSGGAGTPTNAGNGGAGSPGLGGGAGSPLGAGNGGVALGPSGSGGASSFADAACYMIGNLCRYIARCSSKGISESVCMVPSSCPSYVAAALAKVQTPIPPQAGTVLRCFGDALGSASCVKGDLDDGLGDAFGRCGIAISKLR